MSPIPEVDAVEAQRLAQEDGAVLLDVREQDEWDAGHAEGARHVPLAELTTEGLAPDVPVVAVCRSGARSGHATQALRGAGLAVRNLAGGMQAWEAAGLPVVRDDGQPGTVV